MFTIRSSFVLIPLINACGPGPKSLLNFRSSIPECLRANSAKYRISGHAYSWVARLRTDIFILPQYLQCRSIVIMFSCWRFAEVKYRDHRISLFISFLLPTVVLRYTLCAMPLLFKSHFALSQPFYCFQTVFFPLLNSNSFPSRLFCRK